MDTNPDFPEDVKRPTFSNHSFILENASEEFCSIAAKNLKLFGVEGQLGKLEFVLRFPQSNVHPIPPSSLVSEPSNTFHLFWPRFPYDRIARIGVRGKPSNPDKTEKIFGAIISEIKA
jgi:hypothetical protein